jgi:hydrogenase-4 component B
MDILQTVTIFGIFTSFTSASVVGYISKKACYTLGMIGSSFGIILSFWMLLTNATPIDLVFWTVAQHSSFELLLSSFNAFFLLICCLVWLGTCLYSLKYDDYSNGLSSLLALTMLSMVVIILAGDAISFLIGWESMTITSFFMILKGKGKPDVIRKAAFLFLGFGEASTVFVMLAFAGMYSSFESFNFLSISAIHVSGITSSWIFVAALIGFGLKMGIAPFHMSEWLPIAHSNAPSNASAILSATLTLMGVYGYINILTHLQSELWWGWITLVIGGISALLGALFASVSEHSKGLPAYSTIKNNGLIIVAVGIYILASYYHLALLGSFALIAALYHAFSHSISKASLFLIMGWISKVKESFDLNSNVPVSKSEKGGSYLAGIITIFSLAAVPPLAGFVSEWMILEALFQSFRFGDVTSQIIGTITGAITALAAGIIVIAMTKAYGFGILWSGTTDSKIKNTFQQILPIKVSFYYFLFLVATIGIIAPGVFFLASAGTGQILQNHAFDTFVTGLLGVPAYFVILSGKPFGGFSPTFVAIFMLCLLVIPFAITRWGARWKVRKTYGWFSGQSQPTSTLELYNSFGYSTPIRIMLHFIFRTKERIVRVGATRRPVILSPEEYVVELEVVDVFKKFYDTLAKFALSLSYHTARKVMPGKIFVYLIYIMAAFLFVLLYVFFVIT